MLCNLLISSAVVLMARAFSLPCTWRVEFLEIDKINNDSRCSVDAHAGYGGFAYVLRTTEQYGNCAIGYGAYTLSQNGSGNCVAADASRIV